MTLSAVAAGPSLTPAPRGCTMQMHTGSTAPDLPSVSYSGVQVANAHRALENRTYYLLLALIILLAFGLRFYKLDASSLWSDEGNTWAMLARSYGQIAQAAATDIHPPLYYWLLKLWSAVFGASAYAMRSFSAVAGVLLVLVTERIARRATLSAPPARWFPLVAALLAALNPFQIYYSQEARMYILLALESAGLFWALLAILAPGRRARGLRVTAEEVGFVICGTAGLWTHYSFPIILAAAGLAFLVSWWLQWRAPANRDTAPSLLRFIALNLVITLLFAPWLPTALDRVLNWPKGGVPITWAAGFVLTLRTLLFGPVHTLPQLLWLWLLAGAALPLIGLLSLRWRPAQAAFGLWLLLPIGLMAALGLFTPAFLKFLLVTSPAWCLLAAAAPSRLPRPWIGGVLVAIFGAALAWATLPAYYADPVARDNYQGVAAYLAAAGNAATDVVVLDAPGQQEVWRYYDPGLPVLALPATRPANRAQVETALAAATQAAERVYALLWATDEADPDRLVENWLDRNAFKASDAWQGNLRLAAYRFAHNLARGPGAPIVFGDTLVLTGQSQPAFPQPVSAGDAAIVQLTWETSKTLTTDYKVTIQLLDSRNQVIAQRDSVPAGGSAPTTSWQPASPVVDNYALPIPWGTPPGVYRLIAAVYDPATGKRLPPNTTDAKDDAAELGAVVVQPAPRSLPLTLIPMQHRVAQPLGPVVLAGYDAYRKDYAHAPSTPLQPGDVAHFTLYWVAPDPLPAGWPGDQTFHLQLGGQQLEGPLAGGAYATAQWQPGALVRAEFDIPYDGTTKTAELAIGNDRIVLAPLP